MEESDKDTQDYHIEWRGKPQTQLPGENFRKAFLEEMMLEVSFQGQLELGHRKCWE